MAEHEKVPNGANGRGGSNGDHLRNGDNGGRGSGEPGRLSEDAKFLRFAREYVVLLATVAAVPVISNALNVIPAPNGEDQLSILSSLICLITFGGIFLVRGVLRTLVTNRLWLFRVIPFGMSLICIAAGILLTGYYYAIGPTNDTMPVYLTDYLQIDALTVSYLAVYPLFVLALGIVLVTAFTLRRSLDIQELVDARLRPYDDALYLNLSRWADYDVLSSRDSGSLLKSVGDKLLSPVPEYLKHLCKGTVEMAGIHIPQIQKEMMDRIKTSFHAVSDRDMMFWSGDEDPKMLTAYFSTNLKAVCDERTVTRIFILSESELKKYADVIAEVLWQQHCAKIGWAIAIFEQGIEEIGEKARDFALFDWDQAVTYFREHRKGRRQFVVTFKCGNEDSNDQIHEQIVQYGAILRKCWAANHWYQEMLGMKKNIWNTYTGSRIPWVGNSNLNLSEQIEQIKKQNACLSLILRKAFKSHDTSENKATFPDNDSGFWFYLGKDGTREDIGLLLEKLIKLRELVTKWQDKPADVREEIQRNALNEINKQESDPT